MTSRQIIRKAANGRDFSKANPRIGTLHSAGANRAQRRAAGMLNRRAVHLIVVDVPGVSVTMQASTRSILRVSGARADGAKLVAHQRGAGFQHG